VSREGENLFLLTPHDSPLTPFDESVMEATKHEKMPRRILMTADTVGGVWTYALELVRALGPHRIEVCLATMGAPLCPEQQAEAEAISHLTLYPSAFKLEWMASPWEEVAEAGEWLLALEKRLQPDLIHLNGYAHGALPWKGPVLVVGHSCVFSWWRSVKGEEAPVAWEHYHRAVSAGLQHADRVVAPTAAMLAELRRYYGPLPKSAVIPNGRTAARYTVGEKEPFIFTAGRLWDEAKNIALLDRIAHTLPWQVYVAGEQRHPDGRGVGFDSLRSLGRLHSTTLAGWLARAAIYALPARYEPFGLAPLEAALSGCALVLADLPSLREVWGEAALFASPDDPAAFQSTLQHLIEDPSLRESMARQAHAQALCYTPERMAAGYLNVYGEMMKGDCRLRISDWGMKTEPPFNPQSAIRNPKFQVPT